MLIYDRQRFPYDKKKHLSYGQGLDFAYKKYALHALTSLFKNKYDEILGDGTVVGSGHALKCLIIRQCFNQKQPLNADDYTSYRFIFMSERLTFDHLPEYRVINSVKVRFKLGSFCQQSID